MRAKRRDGLQLEAGKLQHVPPVRRARSRSWRMTGVPMLPPTCAGTPAERRMWPIRLVVVVLPLEPVMPMVRPAQKRRRQFDFADHRTPRARAPLRAPADRPARREKARSGPPLRTPPAPAGKRDAQPVQQFARLGQFLQRLQIRGAHAGAPGRQQLRPPPCPDFFIPTTNARVPGPGSILISVSTSSARTAPAPARRSRSAR